MTLDRKYNWTIPSDLEEIRSDILRSKGLKTVLSFQQEQADIMAASLKMGVMYYRRGTGYVMPQDAVKGVFTSLVEEHDKEN